MKGSETGFHSICSAADVWRVGKNSKGPMVSISGAHLSPCAGPSSMGMQEVTWRGDDRRLFSQREALLLTCGLD